MEQTFIFWMTVEVVHDGDTLYGDCDQGIGIHNRGKSPNGMGFRLAGCNARELSQPGGPEARDHLATILPVGWQGWVESLHWDEYAGRIDIRVTLPDGTDLVDQLIAEQWAAAYNGSGPMPIPPWPRTVQTKKK